MTGPELATHRVAKRCPTVFTHVQVYARVDPAQKIRIVEALQARGECVAMTGDGVNDAPALRKADIGVAMGRGGTDVAREASDLVLLDDNFATIVAAVREGRRIYDNIRKFVRFVMAGNAGEIWTIFLAPFLGLPIPLTPIQILWVNFVTDGLPGLALASEPAEPSVMRRPPRPRDESVFAHGVWQHILWAGLLIGGVSLYACHWALVHGAHAQTMTFTVLTFAQLAHVMAIRSERESLFAIGVASNRLLLLAVAVSIALHLTLIYAPWLQRCSGREALSAAGARAGLRARPLVFVGVEMEKWAIRQRMAVSGSACRAGVRKRTGLMPSSTATGIIDFSSPPEPIIRRHAMNAPGLDLAPVQPRRRTARAHIAAADFLVLRFRLVRARAPASVRPRSELRRQPHDGAGDRRHDDAAVDRPRQGAGAQPE